MTQMRVSILFKDLDEFGIDGKEDLSRTSFL